MNANILSEKWKEENERVDNIPEFNQLQLKTLLKKSAIELNMQCNVINFQFVHTFL